MKNCRLPIADCRLPVAAGGARHCPIENRKSKIGNGFTLIELLVVISILGILAGLAVPALKNLGKSNVQVSASRQLLDDVGRARQLAISQRTTVYMVFVPANFWTLPGWNNVPPSLYSTVTNLLDKQCSGYNFVCLRSVGDQPGRGVANYLGEWKSLPDGAFIATSKFNAAYRVNPYFINDVSANAAYPVYSFNTNALPFPTATYNPGISLPYVAFNYLGQLTVDGVNAATRDEYIPLAQGTVAYAADLNKNLAFAPADFTENPAGNSTNSMFNLIRIDHLTGRAVQVQQQVQ